MTIGSRRVRLEFFSLYPQRKWSIIPVFLRTTAVASGDLAKKITVDVRGEILELKDTINTMVDQLVSVRVRSHTSSWGDGGRKGNSAAKPKFKVSLAPGKISLIT